MESNTNQPATGDGSAAESISLPPGNDLLRTVVDNLPDSIFAKDRAGRFILANAAIVRIIGAGSAEALLGRTDAEIGVPLAAHYQALDDRVINAGEQLINVVERVEHEDGSVRWDLTTKVPFRDEHGAICGLVAISRDITAQKVGEEQLQAANAELSRAMERLQTAHQELRAAQAELVEAEKYKSIGRLASGVAHEVQNPLAIATMGLAYVAQQTFPEGSAVPIVLQDIQKALSRADQIVRGLLEYSAADRLELARHDLHEIIREALAAVPVTLASPMRVETEFAPALPLVPLHREKIGQVMVSLLTNAQQAMAGREQSALTIRTRTEQLTGVGKNIGGPRSELFRAGDRLVIVQIDDTGPGIPPDQLRKIFEPFFTTKPTGVGVGIGLSVTKTIMDLHGASLEIQNRAEGGVRAELTFKA